MTLPPSAAAETFTAAVQHERSLQYSMQTTDYLVRTMDTLEVLDPHNIIRLSIVKQIPRHYFAITDCGGQLHQNRPPQALYLIGSSSVF